MASPLNTKARMTEIEDTVATLLEARRSGTAAPAPTLSDAAAAYAVQAAVAEALGWFGDTVPRHWKSGGPSRDAVATHAPLPPGGVWHSPARSKDWPFNLRGIEAEVALRVRDAVTPANAEGLDLTRARALVDAMCVSIEVVDSRWQEGSKAPALAKLADMQSHGALVLGRWLDFDDVRDWAMQPCSVRIGSAPAKAFVGTHPMADPAFVLLAWLKHLTRDGADVPAGTVVTTGSWCGILPAQPGDEVHVVFEGLGDATLQL
jgi:2-keto-4-pentenoate hydratase